LKIFFFFPLTVYNILQKLEKSSDILEKIENFSNKNPDRVKVLPGSAAIRKSNPECFAALTGQSGAMQKPGVHHYGYQAHPGGGC